MSEPRTDQFQSSDVRPMVAKGASRRDIWIFGVVIVLVAVILFAMLDTSRRNITAPAVAAPVVEEGSFISSPAELSIPPMMLTPVPIVAASPVPGELVREPVRRLVPMTRQSPAIRALIPEPRAALPPVYNLETTSSTPVAPPPGPQMVYDAARNGNRPRGLDSSTSQSDDEAERVEARQFSNPATTIPKGTVIQAVLESALDSTRPGFARAIVSRDVYGFDGTRILIPRGSKLIGEYKADVATGQRRALVEWDRLMRPDGVILNLASPSADPLGRAGVKGKVHSHFTQRFAGALLQSALNIGSQVGVNELTGGATIVTIPVGQQAAPPLVAKEIPPTLTVRHGTSVSVFVARDLDFTSVEQ